MHPRRTLPWLGPAAQAIVTMDHALRCMAASRLLRQPDGFQDWAVAYAR